MRSSLVSSACAGFLLANAQSFDMAAIAAIADAVSTPTIPVVYKIDPAAAAVTSAISTYDAASALAIASAAATLPASVAIPIKRGLTTVASKATCVPQPTGISHRSSPDLPRVFKADPYYANIANAADTPSGYVKTFTNLNASNNAYGYMGYTLLPSYDVECCAARCNAIAGCMSFNIYFERDPSVNPNSPSCSNPPSVTQVKCAYWGGPVNQANALNYGQWRNQFKVVIAGSNGYMNTSISTPKGYDEPTYLGDYTISTPNDCDGTNPYLTYKLFTQGPYDVTLCSAACASLSAANRVYAAQNPSLYNGTHAVETCQFFTSYVLYKNGKGLGQYCAMYSRTFEGTKLAVNRGYEYGADRYTIGYSYSYANITDAGSAPTC